MEGRDLAVAWLGGYLTGSSRDDDRWATATADLSTPELLVERRGSGPTSVGSNPSNPWRVTEIGVNAGVNPLVDTSSWEALINAAVVTDSHRTPKQRATTPYSYRQADGRPLVVVADQHHASEG